MKPGLAARLMLGYAVAIAAVLFAAWWGYRSLADTEFAARRLSDRSIETLELTRRLERLVEEKSRLSDLLLSDVRELRDASRPHRKEFYAWVVAMDAFVRSEGERRLLDQMRGQYRRYVALLRDVVRLQHAGRTEEARHRFLAVSASVEDLIASGRQLSALSQESMRERRARMDDVIAHEHVLLSWLTGGGAILSLMLGFALARYATRPIYRLVLRLDQAGVVDSISVDGDEIGALEAHVGALLDRVREQERALQQAEKLSEIGEIASEIAHETLNPIAGVKGMLQALRRTELPPDRVREELRDMERQLLRVETTVRRLMRYARPLEPHMRAVPVRGVLESAVAAAHRAPSTAGRTLRVFADGVEGVEWNMDGELIEQVLVNLLVNGCEASLPGEIIELRAEVQRGRLALSVHDRGGGVAPAVRDRLFRPFVTTKRDGNGLGLAVSRNIVQEHGGSIDAVTGDGGECIFRVVLPPGGMPCPRPS